MGNSKIKEVIEEYTGRKIKDDVESYKDPHNPNVTAFKANIINSDIIYFLYNKMDGKLSPDVLEEVEFETWPPTSDRKNMYNLENMRIS